MKPAQRDADSARASAKNRESRRTGTELTRAYAYTVYSLPLELFPPPQYYQGAMRLLRLATLVTGFFGLQLSLAGDGSACLVTAHGTSGAAQTRAARAAVAEMPMASMETAPAEHSAAQAPTPSKRPCDDSGAPRSCQTPASCTVAFATADSSRTATALPASDAPVLTVLAPSSLVLPPELPPPRA